MGAAVGGFEGALRGTFGVMEFWGFWGVGLLGGFGFFGGIFGVFGGFGGIWEVFGKTQFLHPKPQNPKA